MPRKKTTKESIDQEILDLKAKRIKVHLDEEKKKIKDIKCGMCETPLKVDPKNFLKKGVKAKMFVCPNCDMQNRVQVKYTGNPEVEEAIITQSLRDYAWETKAPGKFGRNELEKWFSTEAERVEGNRSRFPKREDQIIIMAINEILKTLSPTEKVEEKEKEEE